MVQTEAVQLVGSPPAGPPAQADAPALSTHLSYSTDPVWDPCITERSAEIAQGYQFLLVYYNHVDDKQSLLHIIKVMLFLLYGGMLCYSWLANGAKMKHKNRIFSLLKQSLQIVFETTFLLGKL